MNRIFPSTLREENALHKSNTDQTNSEKPISATQPFWFLLLRLIYKLRYLPGMNKFTLAPSKRKIVGLEYT